jgi:hypothetical protein
MIWGEGVTGPFLTIAAVFLLVSAVILFLLWHALARAGVDSWERLPGKSRFKSYERQRKISVGASALVGLSGLGLLLWALLRRYCRRLDADAHVGPIGGSDIVEFLSLQDLKGSQYFGGSYDKLKAHYTV